MNFILKSDTKLVPSRLFIRSHFYLITKLPHLPHLRRPEKYPAACRLLLFSSSISLPPYLSLSLSLSLFLSFLSLSLSLSFSPPCGGRRREPPDDVPPPSFLPIKLKSQNPPFHITQTNKFSSSI